MCCPSAACGNDPSGVAVDSTGDRLRHRHRQQAGAEVGGRSTTQKVLPFTGLQPHGMAVDGTGTVYVADTATTGC